MDKHLIQIGRGGGEVEILLVALCYRNRDMLWPDGPFGWYPAILNTDVFHKNPVVCFKIVLDIEILQLF